MILAAGRGERVSPLSLIRPKCLFPLWGRPLLYLALDRLLRAGVLRVVINACHLADQVERAIAEYRPLEGPFKAALIVSREAEPLGPGGGLRQAAPYLDDGPFFALNSDVVTDLDLAALALAHQQAGPKALATLALLEHPRLANVAVGDGQAIVGFRKPGKQPGERRRLAYGSQMVLNPAFLDYLPPGASDTVLVLQQALTEGALVKGPLFKPGYWRNVDSPEDYFLLHQELQPKLRPGRPENGRANWAGWNWAAPEAKVAAGAFLKNVILWPEAEVEAGSRLEDAIVFGRVSPASPGRGWLPGRASAPAAGLVNFDS